MEVKQYPYIPNSSATVRQEMLDAIGAKSVEEIYAFIPQELRMAAPLNLPQPCTSEQQLKKHMNTILGKNKTCDELISFLGAGCYDHYVPAICDEINGRSEFLTAYSGDTYADHGKLQTFFEFSSMMGELLELDVVNFPTYDGGQAASTAIMMAKRINGRSQVLVPATMNPNMLAQLKCYCGEMTFIAIAEKADGQLDMDDLRQKLSEKTCCVWIENPSFLGVIESQGAEIGQLVHQAGGEFIVYADLSSLGVLTPPALYGADITCGDIQPLGIHMSYGSGLGGYIATRQEEQYVMNYPHHLHSLSQNADGQIGYIRALPERTSYYVREDGIEFLGTCVGLWAITAAVYLASMGPQGMKDLGENILYKCQYAKNKLEGIQGLSLVYGQNAAFKEFVVAFDQGTVAEVNSALLEQGICGGYDLSTDMPQYGQAMLICVTEKTEFADIDRLAQALKNIL